MKRYGFLILCLTLLGPSTVLAQDGHAMAIGNAATGAPMEADGLYWNPALLALPNPGTSTWTVTTGFSAFDTSNAGSPILKLNDNAVAVSSQDPFQRFQQYKSLFAVKYTNMAGGVLWDQQLTTQSSLDTIRFFNDRNNGVLSPNNYNLDYNQTKQQIATLLVGYSMDLPLGSLPFFSVGGTLKYHDGLWYEKDQLIGGFQQGSSNNSYQYTRTTSTDGLGLSVDAGFFAKFTDALQLAMMFQNIQSNFNWTAQQQTLSLDPNTGQEKVTGTQNVTVNANMPYAVKLGLTAAPPDKNIVMLGQVEWVNHQTNWNFGLERYYPDNSLAIRLGTFFDHYSNSQMWCFGAGIDKPTFNVDLAFLTRSLPDIENSIALGGGLDIGIRF
jgi:hypothetical protein